MTRRLLSLLRMQRELLAVSVASLGGVYLVGQFVVDDFSVPVSVLLLGVILGLTYGLLAVGLVLVYRTSGVVNFAHGEVGTLAASFFGIWVADRAAGGFGLPYWLMFPGAIAVAALANMTVETVAVRRLRRAPKVMSLVMTLGAAHFFLLVSLAVNTKIRSGSLYPRPPGFPSFNVGALSVTPEYTAMLVLTPLLVAGLALFLNRSRFGVALRAAAENRDTALMNAIPADRMSSLAWGLAGGASAFVAVLQFPQRGFIIGGAALGPALLVRAMVPAVVARLMSLPVALAFGVVLGVVEQIVLWNTSGGGPTEIVVFVILLVVLLTRPREGSRTRGRDNWTDIRPWPPLPEAWRRVPRVRQAGPVAMAAGAVLFVAVGLLSNRVALAFTIVVAFTMVGLSVYVITGMAGQLSLGQFAVAGVGAVAAVHFVADVFRSIPAGVVVGGLVGAALSMLIGIPALRVSGLMLGVTTLSFAVAAEAWFFAQSWAVGTGVQPPRLVVVDELIGSSREYFLFTLPFLLGALWLVRNVNRNGYGRMLRSLRDNEDGARAFGVPATRRKLEAFALAGFLAGAGGTIYAFGLPRLSISTFTASQSITVVAIALIGGLALMAGPLLGALYLVALPALVDLDAVGLAVSTFGWLILLLYFPGGLGQAVKPLRDRVLAFLAGSAQPEDEVAEDVVGQIRAAAAAAPTERMLRGRQQADAGGRPLLEVHGVSRAFGSIRAVEDVSLTVARGETVGIIGPNGAGKTTLFELIGGFTATDTGRIVFDGIDVTRATPERRAQLGLIRSFQDARLFPTLTVRETLQLASERTAPTSLWTSMAAWPAALDSEDDKRALADELIGMMGLAPFADKTISELSTGTRRIAELAALVAMRPRLVLLDEPSSGVAQRETEALGGLLARLKTMLDTTFVVIEHDMPLLLGISDRVVAMATGRVIAVGPPDAVVNHPEVVASYLGNDRMAVERSGAFGAATAAANGKRHSRTPVAAPVGTTPGEVL